MLDETKNKIDNYYINLKRTEKEKIRKKKKSLEKKELVKKKNKNKKIA